MSHTSYDIDVHLLETETGERAVYRTQGWDNAEDYGYGFANFIWEEGNYACDCNRALFFARASGKPEPDITCSHDRYRVEKIVKVSTGEVVYEEKV